MAMQNLTLCDQQHSVLASAGTARGYTPYGALPSAAGPRLAYVGQLREALMGLYHLGNGYRSYDPCLMRFLSPDASSPFARGGINAYAYCAGDPMNYQDRKGRWPLRNGGGVPDNWSPHNGSVRSQMFRNTTGAEGSYQMSSSTQIYNSDSKSVTVEPSWGEDAAKAWMYASATSAVAQTLTGFKQISYNPGAAATNFVAAGVNAFGAGVAWVEYSKGVFGSLPMTTGEQWLYGLGSGIVKGAQIATTSFAVYMSTPSANGRQSGNDVEMQVLNSVDSSSAGKTGNSGAGELLRKSN